MKIEDFDYSLPAKLIAQEPCKPRDACRLMVVKRETEEIFHDTFRSLPHYLNSMDCLVANNTKVFPARLVGEKVLTKGKVEVLLLKNIFDNHWEVMLKPAKRIREGTAITFGNGKLCALVRKQAEKGIAILQFFSEQNFTEILKELGEIPLPPYIQGPLEDVRQYQTIYAKKEGSTAAPTAGLHFTKEMIHGLERLGIDLAFITLNVGLDTFRPVRTRNIADHRMQSEYFSIGGDAAAKINKAIDRGNSIVAVGTTSVRALESAVSKLHRKNYVEAKQGRTSLFIYPGYIFKVVNVLITNFHLPMSTLLMMVSAFAGRELILKAYKEAIRKEYRFFSFGDCMLIL